MGHELSRSVPSSPEVFFFMKGDNYEKTNALTLVVLEPGTPGQKAGTLAMKLQTKQLLQPSCVSSK